MNRIKWTLQLFYYYIRFWWKLRFIEEFFMKLNYFTVKSEYSMVILSLHNLFVTFKNVWNTEWLLCICKAFWKAFTDPLFHYKNYVFAILLLLSLNYYKETLSIPRSNHSPSRNGKDTIGYRKEAYGSKINCLW